MPLNITLLKAKLPYFFTLLIVGTYANYLFRGGFTAIDLFTGIAVSTGVIWKPNVLEPLLPKYDTYDFIASFPLYLFMTCIFALAFMLGNYMKIVSIDYFTIIRLVILMSLFVPIVDMSRYTND